MGTPWYHVTALRAQLRLPRRSPFANENWGTASVPRTWRAWRRFSLAASCLRVVSSAVASNAALSAASVDTAAAKLTALAMVSPSEALASSSLSSRSEEHTSELQSLMRISYAVFCLKKKKVRQTTQP